MIDQTGAELVRDIRAEFQKSADECRDTAQRIEQRRGLLGDESPLIAHYLKNAAYYQDRADRLAALEAENGRLREALVSVREHIESRRLLFAGVEPRDAKAQTCLDCRQSELAVFERAIFPPSPSEGAL